MPANPTSATVAEVEYYQQLILDQFAKVDATRRTTLELTNSVGGGPNAKIAAHTAEAIAEAAAKRSKAIQRLLKTVDQLRTECEKLAVTGLTAERAAAMAERQKRRFGIPAALRRAGEKQKTPNSATSNDSAGPSPAISISSEDPALGIAEQWRWQAYAYEFDALFASKFDGARVKEDMWEGSLVASTLRSRMHALLFELIPLERVLDGGKIRRGNNTNLSAPTTIEKKDSPATASSEGSVDEYLVKMLSSNVKDALEQLRSACRDAITIKETSLMEARLRASQASIGSSISTPATTANLSPFLVSDTQHPAVTSHFQALHTNAALSPFELQLVQFFSAEAARVAVCYGIKMEEANSSASGGGSSATAQRPSAPAPNVTTASTTAGAPAETTHVASPRRGDECNSNSGQAPSATTPLTVGAPSAAASSSFSVDQQHMAAVSTSHGGAAAAGHSVDTIVSVAADAGEEVIVVVHEKENSAIAAEASESTSPPPEVVGGQQTQPQQGRGACIVM